MLINIAHGVGAFLAWQPSNGWLAGWLAAGGLLLVLPSCMVRRLLLAAGW